MPRPPRERTSRLEQAALLAKRRGSLVDLLVARRCVRGALVDRATDLVELEIIGYGVDRQEVYDILEIAGLGHALNVRALVRVVALTGDRELLVYLAALGFLFGLLADLERQGQYRGYQGHCQHHRHYHELPQHAPLPLRKKTIQKPSRPLTIVNTVLPLDAPC
jgi:hypothetical protein